MKHSIASNSQQLYDIAESLSLTFRIGHNGFVLIDSLDSSESIADLSFNNLELNTNNANYYC